MSLRCCSFAFVALAALVPSVPCRAEERNRQKLAADTQLLRLFADTLDQVERNYVKPVDRRELMEAAIRGMLSKLDPHSNYIPPAELDRFKSSVENEFGGIGMTVTLGTGKLTVVSPDLRLAGLSGRPRGGDTIVEIDGQSTDGWIRSTKPCRRVKGKIGTTVKLTVKHAAAARRRRSKCRASWSASIRCWATAARPTTPGTFCSTRKRRSATSASPTSAGTRPTSCARPWAS